MLAASLGLIAGGNLISLYMNWMKYRELKKTQERLNS